MFIIRSEFNQSATFPHSYSSVRSPFSSDKIGFLALISEGVQPFSWGCQQVVGGRVSLRGTVTVDVYTITVDNLRVQHSRPFRMVIKDPVTTNQWSNWFRMVIKDPVTTNQWSNWFRIIIKDPVTTNQWSIWFRMVIKDPVTTNQWSCLYSA